MVAVNLMIVLYITYIKMFNLLKRERERGLVIETNSIYVSAIILILCYIDWK